MDLNKKCCCCLLRPPDRDMTSPYSCFGTTEMYSDMLADCFNIHLYYGKECGICDMCVGRLRDATDFMLQVQRCHTVLQGQLNLPLQLRGADKIEIKLEPSEYNGLNNITTICKSPLKMEADVKTDNDWFVPLTNKATRSSSLKPSVPGLDMKNKSNCSVGFKRLRDDGASHESKMSQGIFSLTTDEALKLKKNTNLVSVCKLKLPNTYNHSEQKDNLTTPEKNCNLHCQVCFKKFKMEYSLDIHNKIAHTTKPYTCFICEKVSNDKVYMTDHIRKHFKPFSCEKCGKKFRCQAYLNNHLATHSLDTPYACTLCSKELKTNDALKKHIQKTHMESKIKCDRKVTHEDREKIYCCEICGKSFYNNSSLISHKLAHTQHKPFTCDYCQQKFKYKGGLNKHILKHMGLFHSCMYCPRTFRDYERFKRHEAGHNGQYAYSCDLCDKQFRNPSNLKKHTRLHTGIKPHMCFTCGKQFASRNNLKTHLQTHVNGSYSCEFCARSYKTEASLWQHKRNHKKDTAIHPKK